MMYKKMDYFNDILDENLDDILDENLDDFLKQWQWPNNLTPYEIRTVKKMFKGKNNKKIGEELFISEKTVKFYLTSVYKKIESKGRSKMFYLFIKFLICKHNICLVNKEKIVKKEETVLCQGEETVLFRGEENYKFINKMDNR